MCFVTSLSLSRICYYKWSQTPCKGRIFPILQRKKFNSKNLNSCSPGKQLMKLGFYSVQGDSKSVVVSPTCCYFSYHPCLQCTKCNCTVHMPAVVSGLSQSHVSCTHDLLTLSSHPYKQISLQISTFQLVKLMKLFKEIHKACLHGSDI